MPDSTHLLKPLEPPYSAAISQILENYPQQGGYLLSLFKVFANSQRFLAGKGVVNLLDDDSPLTLRERELVILRVCANNNCEYEWGVHIAAFAKHSEFTEQQINMTVHDKPGADCWNEQESLLLTVVDELCGSGTLSAATRQRFQSQWNQQEQLEILALCGNYHTISFVANVADIEPEPFGARFPDSA